MPKSTARRSRHSSPGMGSVYRSEDGRRWRGAVSWTEPSGERRRRVVSGATAAQANEKLDALRRELHLGSPLPKGRAPTVGEFLDEWLERDAARVRPSTHAVRVQHVKLWIEPSIGSRALARLTPADVEHALAEFLKSGRPRGADAGRSGRPPRRAVSPLTVQHVRATLRTALSDAERDGLVSRNAAAQARPPRAPYAAITYLDTAQVRRLLDATRDHEYGPLFAVAVSTGLRQGELLGLAWTDIDFEGGTLTVRRSLALTADGGYGLSEPKSAKSRRTLPLPTVAREALRRQRVRQDEARLAAGTAWQDPARRDGLVFTDGVGRPLDGSHVTYMFRRSLAAAGLPRVRFHDLRHSAATLMLAQGIGLATVSEMLGHSGIQVTAQRYAAIVPELKRDAAEAVDRALSGTA